MSSHAGLDEVANVIDAAVTVVRGAVELTSG
jgi:hypothetical protein